MKNNEGVTIKRLAPYRIYSPYEPTQIGLNDVPYFASEKLANYLGQRIGSFREQLTIKSFQSVDTSELYRLKPSARDVPPPRFIVIFSFSLPDLGLEIYECSVELDNDGKVLKDIDIPNLVEHPERHIRVSLEAATKAAKEKGLPGGIPEFRFSREKDNWFWTFRQPSSSEITIYEISAGSGEVSVSRVPCKQV